MRWETLGEGTTDASGRVALGGARRESRPHGDRAADRRAKGDDILVLDADARPDGFADGQWSTEQRHLAAVDAARPRHVAARTAETSATSSPSGRSTGPEEEVHIKGYLRVRDQGELPRDAPRRPGHRHGPGDLVWRYPVTLTAPGSFYHQFREKLPTGVYTRALRGPAGAPSGVDHLPDGGLPPAALRGAAARPPSACRSTRSSTVSLTGDLLRRRPGRGAARSSGA